MDIYQQISKELIKEDPESVKTIQNRRKSNDEYPSNLYNFISNNLKNNLQLQKQFQKLDINKENEKQIYDSIFLFQIDEDNTEEHEGDNFEEEEEWFDNNDDDDAVDISISYSSYDFDIHPSTKKEEEEEDHPENHKILDPKLYQAQQTKKIDKLSKKFSLSPECSYQLLKKFKWNDQFIIKQWEKIKLDIIVWLKSKKDFKSMKIGKGNCPICYDENCDLYQLYCGHFLCYNCLTEEIRCQIEENSFPVICRQDNCNSEIILNDIQLFCGEKEAQNYQQKYIEYQMNIENELIKCISPNCNQYLNKKFFDLCNIGKCYCGKRMCLKCQQDSHAPLRCDQVEKYEKIEQDMIKLAVDQQNWMNKELNLMEYRKEHIDEVMKFFDDYKNHFINEIDELNKKENKEIDDLNEQIKNTEDNEINLNLRIKLVDKKMAHKFNVDERSNELDDLNNYINEYIGSINSKDAFFFNQEIMVFDANNNTTQKIQVKKCPRCNVIMYRDGGCNHMTCKYCRHEFCWVCLGEWITHSNSFYKCPFVDTKEDNESNTSNNNNETNMNNNNNEANANNNNNEPNTTNNNNNEANTNNNNAEPNTTNNNNNEPNTTNNNNNEANTNNNNAEPNTTNNNNEPNTNNNNNEANTNNNNAEPNTNNNNNEANTNNNNAEPNTNNNNNEANTNNNNNEANTNNNNNEANTNNNNAEPNTTNNNNNEPNTNNNNNEANTNNNNNENAETNNNNSGENTVPQTNKEFSLPPMNTKMKSFYNRWKKSYNKTKDILLAKDKIKGDCFSDYYINTINHAASVLINSYRLLLMLEAGSQTYQKFEYFTEELVKIYKKITNNYGHVEVEIIDSCGKFTENVLFYANVINF